RVEDDRSRKAAGEPAEGSRQVAGVQGVSAMAENRVTGSEPAVKERRAPARAESQLRAQVETLELRLRKRDEQRRAMLHIMGDLNESNKRLANQRKAMLHILADYEQDRRRLARQT